MTELAKQKAQPNKRVVTVTLEGKGVNTIMQDELESRLVEEVRDILDSCDDIKDPDETVTVTAQERL